MIVHTIALIGGLISPISVDAVPPGSIVKPPCISEKALSGLSKGAAFKVLPGHPEKISAGGKIYMHIGDAWCSS
jgi:hypothetical protein